MRTTGVPGGPLSARGRPYTDKDLPAGDSYHCVARLGRGVGHAMRDCTKAAGERRPLMSANLHRVPPVGETKRRREWRTCGTPDSCFKIELPAAASSQRCQTMLHIGCAPRFETVSHAGDRRQGTSCGRGKASALHEHEDEEYGPVANPCRGRRCTLDLSTRPGKHPTHGAGGHKLANWRHLWCDMRRIYAHVC